jgi:hypothetical protein
MWSKLLQAKSDSSLLLVEVKYYNIDLLVEANDLFWVVNSTPRKICDVNKTINTAEVNEYTIRCDVLNSSLKNLSLLKVRDDLLI